MRDSVSVVSRALRRIAFARRLTLAAATGVAVMVLGASIITVNAGSADAIAWLPSSRGIVGAAMTIAIGVFAWLHVRRTPISTSSAALWIEEQSDVTPDFTLVTWVEQGAPSDGALAVAAKTRLAATALPVALRRLALSQCGAPLLFLIGGVLLWHNAGRSTRGVVGADASAPPLINALVPNARTVLQPWAVEVVPPPYVMRRAESLGDVSAVRALEGSRIVVRGAVAVGNSDAEALPRARVRTIGDIPNRESAWRVDRDGDRWAIRTLVRDSSIALIVMHDSTQRQLVVESVADTIPQVTLQAPVRDSVFRTVDHRVALVALASDDLGLANASFEVVITSGEGERFTVRTVHVAKQSWTMAARTRRAVMRATLDLSTLGLQPGDVLHVRAIARDHHPDPARDIGSSETRAFRIARPSEYDSVAVEPAPPPAVDSSLLSQRMLLLLTQKLDRRQRSIPRPEVVRESQRLARDQARLRLAVGDVVFQRLSGESSAEHAHSAGDGHDHGVELQGGKLTIKSEGGVLDEGNDSPVVAINQPLLEAYNAMWDAGRALEQGDPHAAIPPMQRALEAIERSRAASRLYLRGRPPQVIVDIAKVRLTGRDTGTTAPRSIRRPLPAAAAARDRRLIALVSGRVPALALRDSLAVLRIEALQDAPAFASAIGSALDALAAGRDITPSLIRARQALSVVRRVVPTQWTRGVPRQ